MKRRLLTMLMAAVMAGTALTGCGSDGEIDKAIVETEDEEEAVEEQEAEVEEVTIEEAVLLDESGIKITTTGMEDGWMGTELKLLIENNSDTDVTVQARNSSVNGFMVETMLSEDVATGKKANTTLTFSTSGLKEANITTITDMEFAFHIFDSETWDEYLDSEMIVVETSAAGSYEQSVDDSGTVFYDADGVKIIGKGLSTDDSIFGPGLIVFIENDSDRNITVQVRDTSVNGFMIDTSMSQDVMAGKKAYTAATFFDSSLEENGIEEITQVETSFHIFDMDSWDTISDTDPIVVDFE